MSNGPGPKKLIAGDLNHGFYGEVPASELWTGTELSALLGITQGTIQFNDTPWLKWAYQGKTLFRPKKAFRHSISWNYLNGKGVVYGGKTITHENGYSFNVRLMKGTLTDPSKNNDSDRGAKYSEWNRLMLPIHVRAKDKSWAYPAHVEDDIPYWGIDYTDADLQVGSGNGRIVWCQETSASISSERVRHGGSGVSASGWSAAWTTGKDHGFAPVLELLTPPSTSTYHISNEKEDVKYTLIGDTIIRFTEKDDDFPELSLPIDTEVTFTKLIDYDTKEETEINHTLPSFFKDRHDGKMRIVQQDDAEEEFKEVPHEIITTCFTDHLSELLQHDDVKIYAFTEEYDDFEVSFKHTPNSALLLADGDIGIKSVENIDFFQVDSADVGDAEVKMIVSVDEGETWHTYDGGWFEIDATVDQVEKFGIPKDIFNDILPAAWNDLRKFSDKIRFGYLIKYNQEGDDAVVKSLNAQFDMTGTWKSAIHGKDYEYEYPDNSTIIVKILTSGDYKINY